jgi:RNA polymerase sigma-70 factor (ECF subfamily)
VSTQPEDSAADPFAELLRQARGGSRDALGIMLQGCRWLLLYQARRQIPPVLRAKAGPADLVQDTFLEAQRDFDHFHGQSQSELAAWLGRILQYNCSNFCRAFCRCGKRWVRLEVSLEGAPGLRGQLRAEDACPSLRAIRGEDAAAYQSALKLVAGRYAEVLRLRTDENLSFSEIGTYLGCSAEAARKRWARGKLLLTQQWARHLPDLPQNT